MISQSQNPYIKQYTTSNGLPSNMVYRIFQDSRKFIWMATDAGVTKYDGTNFQYFTTKNGLNTNEVIHIQEDSRGRIWLFNFNGTFNFYFRGKIFNGKNAPYLDSLQSPFLFRKMYEDEEGTLYFYDNFYRDVYLLDIKNNVTKLSTSEWFSGAFDIDKKPIFQNSLRFLKSKGGFFYYLAAGGLYKVQNIPDSPKPIDESNEIHRVFSINNDLLFADVQEKKSGRHLLLKYKSFQISDTIETPFRFEGELLNDVVQDNSFNYWVSTNFGLFYTGNRQIFFELTGRNFQNIIIDNEENIWVCSLGNGIYKISPYLLTLIHLKGELFENNKIIETCVRSKGGIWAISGQSIYYVRDYNVLNSRRIVNRGHLTQISELQNNNIILGQLNYGLKALSADFADNKSLKTQIKEIDNSVFKMFSVNSRKDKFFALYPSRVIEFPQENLNQENKNIHYSEERIYNIWHDAKDQLFVNGKRLYLFKEGKFIPFKPLKKIYGKIIEQHLNLSGQLELFNVDGNQLYLFNGQKLFDLSNVFDPLIDQPVKYLTYQDPHLFIATNSQIYFCSIAPGKSFPSKVKLNNLDIEFKNIHHLLVHNNELIISSDDGLSFMPLKTLINVASQPPIPYFRNILVNDKPATIKDAQTVFTGNNKLQFTLGNIRYNASQVHYAFRLLGWDKTWKTGIEPTVIYQDLKPGIYTFVLKTKLSSSTWSEEIKHTVRVRPTLFQHPLFFVFSSVTVMILLYLVLNNYQKAFVKRKEREHQIVVLEQKALHLMMNPHFIFNVLGSIQSYILKNNNTDAGLYLSQFSRLIRQTLKAAKISTIELEEEISRLKNYLELEQLRMNNRFNFTISVDKSIDDEILIPSMILQPIVENAIWHGLSNIDSDGLILIQFIKLEENLIKITIEDNGIGIKQAAEQPNQKEAHLKIGSELTRKRLAILGKKMNVKTSFTIFEAFPGKPRPGTRVEIIAPISYNQIEIE